MLQPLILQVESYYILLLSKYKAMYVCNEHENMIKSIQYYLNVEYIENIYNI